MLQTYTKFLDIFELLERLNKKVPIKLVLTRSMFGSFPNMLTKDSQWSRIVCGLQRCMNYSNKPQENIWYELNQI